MDASEVGGTEEFVTWPTLPGGRRARGEPRDLLWTTSTRCPACGRATHHAAEVLAPLDPVEPEEVEDPDDPDDPDDEPPFADEPEESVEPDEPEVFGEPSPEPEEVLAASAGVPADPRESVR
jgi:hypothetical protein